MGEKGEQDWSPFDKNGNKIDSHARSEFSEHLVRNVTTGAIALGVVRIASFSPCHISPTTFPLYKCSAGWTDRVQPQASPSVLGA